MHFLTPDHVVAIVERTFLFVVRRPPTVALVDLLEAQALAAIRVHPPLAYMHVVLDLPSTGRVDEPTRTAFAAMARRTGPRLAGAAMVLLRDGFAGAAMRATVSGALLVIRPSIPVRVFSSVKSATAWVSVLQAKEGITRDTAAIERALAEIEATLRRDFVP